jgi:hypothetical protein
LAKVPVSPSKIDEKFDDQLSFLRKSIAEYDAGDTSEYQRMALAIRILLHETKKSHSLRLQAGLQEALFVSMAQPINKKNLVAVFRLALVEVSGKGAQLKPILDTLGFLAPRLLKFSDWWSEPVLRDNHQHFFRRRDIVLAVADMDGGGHVDPEIDEAYHRLANENSIGLLSVGPDGEMPVKYIERVYVRHIAWEVLTSLEWARAEQIGNRKCSCGSGRKFRYCGAKGRCGSPAPSK